MWFVFALGASFFWGITYFFEEHVYRHISVLTSLTFTFLIGGLVFGALALLTGSFQRDTAALMNADHRTIAMLVIVTIASIAAELLIGFSISHKNATISGLVEITYPLFVALIGYVLIRENNLNLPTAIGALFIFIGIGSIYVFNR